MKEKARFRRRAMEANWARMFALGAQSTLCLSRISIPSLRALLDRSESGRVLLKL